MFGKKDNKPKELTPEEKLRLSIEEIQPGKEMLFTFPEAFGGGLAIVQINPQYPEKGKKYTLHLQDLTNGKPAGNRQFLSDFNKPKDVSNWVMGRRGTLFQG